MYIIQMSMWSSVFKAQRTCNDEAIRRVTRSYFGEKQFTFTPEEESVLLAYSEKVLVFNNDYPSVGQMSSVICDTLTEVLETAVKSSKAVIHKFTRTNDSEILRNLYGENKIHMECVQFTDTQATIRAIKIDELCM